MTREEGSMRNFATDKPVMMEFTLGNSKKVYGLPLATSMPVPLLNKMSAISELPKEQQESASVSVEYEVLRHYIGDAADTLTASQIGEIFAAWFEESAGEAGVSVGESSGSSE